MFKELLKRNVHGRLDGRYHRRDRCVAISHCLRYCFGGIARKRYYYRYHCRIYHFPVGRKQSPDRWPDRSIYRHYLRHHPAIRRSRTDCSHTHGRCTPYFIRSVQARSGYQVHPLSYHRRFYQRYCCHYFHYPDRRYFRSVFRRRESAGGLRREVDDLFPSFRYYQLVEYHRKYCQHYHHRHHSEILKENSRLTDCHHRCHSSRLSDENFRWNRLHPDHRRPFHHQIGIA